MRTVPCKGCGRPIAFASTPDGSTVPLDPRPPVYAVVVADQDDTPVTVVRNKVSFVSHFATCPKAGDFSRGRKKGNADEPQDDPDRGR